MRAMRHGASMKLAVFTLLLVQLALVSGQLVENIAVFPGRRLQASAVADLTVVVTYETFRADSLVRLMVSSTGDLEQQETYKQQLAYDAEPGSSLTFKFLNIPLGNYALSLLDVSSGLELPLSEPNITVTSSLKVNQRVLTADYFLSPHYLEVIWEPNYGLYPFNYNVTVYRFTSSNTSILWYSTISENPKITIPLPVRSTYRIAMTYPRRPLDSTVVIVDDATPVNVTFLDSARPSFLCIPGMRVWPDSFEMLPGSLDNPNMIAVPGGVCEAAIEGRVYQEIRIMFNFAGLGTGDKVTILGLSQTLVFTSNSRSDTFDTGYVSGTNISIVFEAGGWDDWQRHRGNFVPSRGFVMYWSFRGVRGGFLTGPPLTTSQILVMTFMLSLGLMLFFCLCTCVKARMLDAASRRRLRDAYIEMGEAGGASAEQQAAATRLNRGGRLRLSVPDHLLRMLPVKLFKPSKSTEDAPSQAATSPQDPNAPPPLTSSRSQTPEEAGLDALSPYSIHSCAICMSDFAAGERVKALPCQHAYHEECIDAWLARSVTCPLCQTNVLQKLQEQQGGAALAGIPEDGSSGQHSVTVLPDGSSREGAVDWATADSSVHSPAVVTVYQQPAAGSTSRSQQQQQPGGGGEEHVGLQLLPAGGLPSSSSAMPQLSSPHGESAADRVRTITQSAIARLQRMAGFSSTATTTTATSSSNSQPSAAPPGP